MDLVTTLILGVALGVALFAGYELRDYLEARAICARYGVTKAEWKEAQRG